MFTWKAGSAQESFCHWTNFTGDLWTKLKIQTETEPFLKPPADGVQRV